MDTHDCCTGPKIRLLPKTLLSEFRCGVEVPVLSTLTDTLNFDVDAKCVQIYCSGTAERSYVIRKFKPEDLKKAKEVCTERDISFYIHGPLIANLAKVDSAKSM